MSWDNGDTYEGDFHLGMRIGNGVFNFKNGTIYKGKKFLSITQFHTYLQNDRSLSKCRKIKNQVKCIGIANEQKYFNFKDVKIKQTTRKTSLVGV